MGQGNPLHAPERLIHLEKKIQLGLKRHLKGIFLAWSAPDIHDRRKPGES